MSAFPRLLVAGTLFVFVASARADEPQVWIKQNIDNLVELYRHFHRNPELSFQEQKTASRLADELAKAGAQVTPGVGRTGVVGLLSNGAGPTLLLRADMDALPVEEKTELVYASKVRSKDRAGKEVAVMHACGHDVHLANLVGVARYLAANKGLWRGTVVFIGQPAEEIGAGAKAMLADGLFKKFPKPDFALAMHVDAYRACGKLGVRSGYSAANVDSVDITMIGRGGHGAYPHRTIDPVVLAAHLVVDLQTIVSREIKPQDPAVVTVGSIHGGTKHNIISDSCHLQLTVRSYSDEVRKHLHAAIRRKAMAVAAGADAPEPTVEISEGTPSLKNDDGLVRRIEPVFRRVLGAANVEKADTTMGGEDFSRYGLAGVPIFMYRVGAVRAQRLAGYQRFGDPPSLHSPLFYPDAVETLTTSVVAMSAAALELLKKAE